jgi:hypothetical protein
MTDELDAVARTEVQAGWDVYSADEDRLGEVDDVFDDGFTVRLTAGGTVRVDFSDIESADDGRVDLTLSNDELPALQGDAPMRPAQAEGAEDPSEDAGERPPRPSQAEGDRDD